MPFFYRTLAAAFAANGFDVLLVDARGWGVSEGECSLDNGTMAQDVFSMLDQLQAGCMTLGAGETSPVERSLLDDAKTHPVVVGGHSQGALIAGEAMRANVADHKGYNLKGAIIQGSPAISGIGYVGAYTPALGIFLPGLGTVPGPLFLEAWYRGKYGIKFYSDRSVVDSVPSWPALFLGHAINESSLRGPLEAYNRNRGWKRIYAVKDQHSPEYYSNWRYLIEKMVRFSKMAVTHTVTRNTEQKTLEQVVCEAPEPRTPNDLRPLQQLTGATPD